MKLRKQKLKRIVPVCLLALSVLILLAASASAAVISVDTDVPEINADGLCSLIEAIENANFGATHADCTAGGGADTIVLGTSLTYTLTSVFEVADGGTGLPVVSSEVTIEGNGSVIERSTVGSEPPLFRIFLVSDQGDLTLNDVTIRNGELDLAVLVFGGCVLNQGGRLTLNNVTMNDCSARAGGAVFASCGETACTAENASGELHVFDSEFVGNVAGVGGGALVVYGVAASSVTRSDVFDNAATRGGGVAIETALMTIVDSTIEKNDADDCCGGIWVLADGILDMSQSAVIGNNCGLAGTTAPLGGGVGVSDGTALIDNSTISGNQSLASSGDGFAAGEGGGIALVSGFFDGAAHISVSNSTIANNGSQEGGSAIAVASGAGGEVPEVFLINSIVDGQFAARESMRGVEDLCKATGVGTINSEGYNLASDNSCVFMETGDMEDVSPLLEELADNGGATRTHALMAGSPALDPAVDTPMCPDADQRGYLRLAEGECDKGAFELGAQSPIFADGFELGDTSAWSVSVQ